MKEVLHQNRLAEGLRCIFCFVVFCFLVSMFCVSFKERENYRGSWASRPNSVFVIPLGFVKSLDSSHWFFLAHLWSLLNPPEKLLSDFAFTVKKIAIEKIHIFILGILLKILYELHTQFFRSHKAVATFTVLSEADQLSYNKRIFTQLPNIIFTYMWRYTEGSV